MMNYAKSLKCEDCRTRYEIDEVVNTCKKCGGLLEVEYDYEALVDDDRQKVFGFEAPACMPYLWKYIHFLPHPRENNIVSMGEGGSPIIALKGISEELGVKVFAKYYGTNPTGTHKDHGMSVAISMAKEIGVRFALTFSTGNAATSLAAYSNFAGIRPIIIMRNKVSPEKFANIQALGATIIQIKELEDPWKLLRTVSDRVPVYYFTNFINPFRAEGHKSLAYESHERIRDGVEFVICPIGTGGGLWGAWKGFKELYEFGLTQKLPHMIASQPEAVMHTAKAFKEGKEIAESFGNPNGTIVQSLADSEPLQGAKRPLKVLRESKGDAVGVRDEDVITSILEIGREGLFVEPASATTLAALKMEIESGFIQKGDTVLLSLTGTGLKQPEAIDKITSQKNIFELEAADVDKVTEILVSVSNGRI